MYRCFKIICCLLLTSNLSAQYIYEGNQSLIDLTNESGTTNLNVGDDQLSSAFNLDFTFDFYGESFTSARMATNGCLHFGLGTGNVNYNNYCGDYTPDPLPQYNYTLFPFWTDLIRDNDSKMLAKNFSDKTVFGWYDLREYNRSNTDNSFEVILWTNDSYEFRYGELDIIQHDVLIGEQGKEDEIYTYYYHDECNTGTTNTSSCYSYDWNNSDKNDNLEDGGSLYYSPIDCSNPLNDSSCAGYADAYQTQQCNIDQLYSQSCPYYWDAYDDLQCDLDPQYRPFCQGYRQEESVAYFVEEELFDYGYEEYDMYEIFEEPIVFEEYVFEEEYDVFEEPEFVFEEEIIFEEFQPIDDFIEPLPFILEEEVFIPIENLMVEEFVFQETFIEEVEEWFEEETIVEEELAYAEEPEEELIEELVEEEDEVIEKEQEEEELVAEEKGSSLTKEKSLAVVASTIKIAKQSVSGTQSGNSIHATGNAVASGNAVSNSSNVGISTSSSPSISDQFASSTAQTNQVLNMSSMSVSDSSFSSTTAGTETVTTEVAVANVTTETTQDQIDTSIASVDSDSETTVENIIAQNLQTAQEQVAAKQEETGEYGSENAIIAVMGFLPGFNSYRAVNIPEKEFWYEPKSIYTNSNLSDNTAAFYGLAGQSIKTLTELKQMQPTL